MNDDSFRVMEFAMMGYQCSQILMAMALEAQGKQNQDLLRAMSGLLGGMGCGKTCGALTGGCSVLGLYAGGGKPGEAADDHLAPMLAEFVPWFQSEFTQRYGSIECAEIVGYDAHNRLARCPQIVMESLAKLKQILADHHYEFNGSGLESPRQEG